MMFNQHLREMVPYSQLKLINKFFPHLKAALGAPSFLKGYIFIEYNTYIYRYYSTIYSSDKDTRFVHNCINVHPDVRSRLTSHELYLECFYELEDLIKLLEKNINEHLC